MKKENFFLKFQNLKLTNEALERQWRIHLNEQEDQQRLLNMLVVSAAASGGGGGSIAPPLLYGLSLIDSGNFIPHNEDGTSRTDLIRNSIYKILSDGNVEYVQTIGGPSDNVAIVYNSTDGFLYFIISENPSYNVSSFNKLNLSTGEITNIIPNLEIDWLPILQMYYDDADNTFVYIDNNDDIYRLTTLGVATLISHDNFGADMLGLIKYTDGNVYNAFTVGFSGFGLYDIAIGDWDDGDHWGFVFIEDIPGVPNNKVIAVTNPTTLNGDVYANLYVQNLDDSTYLYVVAKIDFANFIASFPGGPIPILANYVRSGNDFYGLSDGIIS